MTQVTKLYTAQPHFLAADIISIEIDLSRGLHAFSIVGLAGKAVDEAKDRVSAAIKNSGWQSPKTKNQKVVISLAPADLKKDSTGFDVAMAVAYLLAAKEIQVVDDLSTKLFIGELSLNGAVQGVKGILPIIQAAIEKGFTEYFIPHSNAKEAALIENITIYPIETLAQLIDHMEGKKILAPQPKTYLQPSYTPPDIDMSEVTGQFAAKRALEIALAGGHNIIMYGPAGTGKTMLARAAQGLLPPLSFEEILEVSSLYSLYGHAPNDFHSCVTTSPFRAPHHTASYVSVIGGGAMLRPGEITLAHRGILFLDEMPEFSSQVLETLREPLEEGQVRISRARGSVTYPARFILIGAMNPCACGNFGSVGKVCICSALHLSQYRRKLSGPIADRIDLWVEVSKVEYEKLFNTQHASSEKTVDIAERIKKAREIQKKRSNTFASGQYKRNSELTSRDIRLYIVLDTECRRILNSAAKKMDLSARGYQRVIKTARTIADLAQEKQISPQHIQEALSYRAKVYD